MLSIVRCRRTTTIARLLGGQVVWSEDPGTAHQGYNRHKLPQFILCVLSEKWDGDKF